MAGRQPILGLSGSIPFMPMLEERYPQAQFLITGVLGPKSNAHAPTSFYTYPMPKISLPAWPIFWEGTLC